MLNRASRYNKYSALLIKVILFSSLSRVMHKGRKLNNVTMTTEIERKECPLLRSRRKYIPVGSASASLRLTLLNSGHHFPWTC
ncbi:hypothetical protein MNBD_GAMMA10-2288 [hydrothermal vent metagenome]|uniref:Uncharacterized protein n=1 Tax=hydrothermal vent metagenome TaxID=652676 RepID=A0A3B0XVZ9_9ZZZZ